MGLGEPQLSPGLAGSCILHVEGLVIRALGAGQHDGRKPSL